VTRIKDEGIAAAIAELRGWLDAYMLSPDFEARAILAADEIEKGGLRTARELADALGLPEQFLAIALEKHAAKFIADHGGLN
jgi:hypothetical protein